MAESVVLIDDDDRYARQRLIAWWDQSRLTAAKVLVVGAGALGNEVIKNLVLLGVGRIYVVDFDTIEPSNLARSVLFRAADRGKRKAIVAAERANEINPDSRVIPIDTNVMSGIGLGLFRDVDVVIGCLDNREARLWVNRSCWKVGTPWIDGAIQEINGVVRSFSPPDGPCYECGMTEIDYQLINVRYSCPMLKREEMAAGRAPTTPTIASIVAGWQTQEAVKLLHNLKETTGQALVYNGLTNHCYTTRLTCKPDCLSHETIPEPISLSLSARSSTANDLFSALEAHWKSNSDRSLVQLQLDRDLVTSFHCQRCNTSRDVLRPVQLVNHNESICQNCGEVNRPEMVHCVSANTGLAKLTLRELGIPDYDIVHVRTESQELFALLNEDLVRVDHGHHD